MVPSEIILLVLQGFFGLVGILGDFLGHGCLLKKDSHIHFIWVFFRAFYFIIEALLNFMREMCRSALERVSLGFSLTSLAGPCYCPTLH